MNGLNVFELERNIKAWLEEDMPFGDITSDYVLDENQQGSGQFIAKEEGIICGLLVLQKIFEILDQAVVIEFFKHDGDWVKTKDVIATISGPIGSILKGERLALNIIQRLSGIATMAKQYSKETEGYEAKIVDTRKTTPGFRALEKYAVRIGGCVNHRYSLSDAVLIKDNHIAGAGSITKAVEKAKKNIAHTVKIEVETETLEEVKEAIMSGADIIMLDNMDVEMMTIAVDRIRKAVGKHVTIEASGNMTLDRIPDVAKTGVDIISVGSLTHSVKALDISLKFKK